MLLLVGPEHLSLSPIVSDIFRDYFSPRHGTSHLYCTVDYRCESSVKKIYDPAFPHTGRRRCYTQHQEVARVTEELREAKLQTRSARTAEEASKLTLVALQARNAQFEEEKRGIESRHREQAERSQMELVEVGGGVVLTVCTSMYRIRSISIVLKKKSWFAIAISRRQNQYL